VADVREIAAYIAQDSLDAAERVISTLFSTIEGLVPQAVRHRGHRRPDLSDAPLLFVGVYDYLIAYAPDENPLIVIAILHARRSPRILAKLLADRGPVDP